jgi:anionic cell wall polymer biosynthesis LytR-Cps2A-Psr (LCP) family protein
VPVLPHGIEAIRPRVPGAARPTRRSFAARLARTVAVMAAITVLTVTGYAWRQYQDVAAGLRRSGALSGLTNSAEATTQNILIIGLDSRLDENGNPLPQNIYNALHTGDASVGGYNANVLMLHHIPGDGSRATAISIPRDDYVDLPGSPDGTPKGKICECRCGAPGWRTTRLGAGDPA